MPHDVKDNDRPALAEQLSYVGGEFASNFAWNMITGYLLFYYTDIALLPVAFLGTLMLVSRVLDAIIDPVVGALVDRTRSRWGHARPYLLFASIPFGLLCVAIFAVPEWPPLAKVAYAYVTFTLLGLCYSLLYIPFGALQPMMVRDQAIKVRLGAWRAMSTSLASIVVYSLVLPLANLAGPDNRRAGFMLAASIVAAITVALYLLVFFKCRERFATATAALQRHSLRRDIARLFRNPVWRFVFSYATVTFVRVGVLVSVTAYFANNVLRQPQLLSVLLPLLSVAILIGGFLAGMLMNRFGQRATNLSSLVLSLAMCLLMPHIENNIPLLIAAFMLANLTGGIVITTVFVSCADAVEYGQARYGERNEGLVFAGVSFGMKVGMAVGAAATAYALSWAGYNPQALTEQSVDMTRWLFYYGSAVLCVAQIACVLLFQRGRAAEQKIEASNYA